MESPDSRSHLLKPIVDVMTAIKTYLGDSELFPTTCYYGSDTGSIVETLGSMAVPGAVLMHTESEYGNRPLRNSKFLVFLITEYGGIDDPANLQPMIDEVVKLLDKQTFDMITLNVIQHSQFDLEAPGYAAAIVEIEAADH